MRIGQHLGPGQRQSAVLRGGVCRWTVRVFDRPHRRSAVRTKGAVCIFWFFYATQSYGFSLLGNFHLFAGDLLGARLRGARRLEVDPDDRGGRDFDARQAAEDLRRFRFHAGGGVTMTFA